MPRQSQVLARTSLFQEISGSLPHDKRIRLSYDRALAIGKLYSLSADDILFASPKYWKLHLDPILSMDGSAATLLTIHYNLCCGTFARCATKRPELLPTLRRLLNFELFGQFCLTELGHGLDVFNLETTATLTADGTGFELNTPAEQAAKYMPPTAPSGTPCVAVVFARLIIAGKDCGIKPFSVDLHDGSDTSKGVVIKRLSPRGSSHPLDHSLTYFHRVLLPLSALMDTMEPAKDKKADFFRQISRVAVGTLSMAACALSAMKIGCFVAARYSQRRTVTDAYNGRQRSILSFSTQHIPILTSIAQAVVMDAFLSKCISFFGDESRDYAQRHCIAAVAKTVMIQHCQGNLTSLSDRCGAQGLFEVNQLTVMHADIRGASIAEGDILVLSIRFAVELVIGRISVPEPKDPESLLARHEQSLIEELRNVMATFTHHRDPKFESIVLPQCQPLIEAIGHRIAYEAAKERDIDQSLLDLYVASVIRQDGAWYPESGGISRSEQRAMERDSVELLLPRMDDLLQQFDVEAYCTAPIVSDEKWGTYVGSLPTFGSV